MIGERPVDTGDLAVVGRSILKPDGLAKTSGQARYADDLVLPRMGFCRLLRSTRPHARIVSIDTAAAERLAGVYAVITGRDLPPVKHGILPVGQDEEVLCTDKVRFVGDALAAVAAADEATAEQALDLIRVQYQELPTFLSIEEGLAKPGEPIHAGKYGNAHKAVSFEPPCGTPSLTWVTTPFSITPAFSHLFRSRISPPSFDPMPDELAGQRLAVCGLIPEPHQRIGGHLVNTPAEATRQVTQKYVGLFKDQINVDARESTQCTLDPRAGCPWPTSSGTGIEKRLHQRQTYPCPRNSPN